MTSPIGRDLLSGLTGEDDFDSTTNPALTPLQHSMQVGRALRRMGATPAAVQKPGQPAGFWSNAVAAFKTQLKESTDWITRPRAVLPPPGMTGPTPAMQQDMVTRHQPRDVAPSVGVGGFVGEMAGRLVHPLDLATGAATAGLAGPMISRFGGTVAQKVGRGILGKAVGYGAEGAAFGAIENPVANTLHEMAGNQPAPDSLAEFAKRRAFDVWTGAAFGAVLDPLARGAGALAKGVYRGMTSPEQILTPGVRARQWEAFPDPEDAFARGKRIWRFMKEDLDRGRWEMKDMDPSQEEELFRIWLRDFESLGRKFQSELDAYTAFDDVREALSKETGGKSFARDPEIDDAINAAGEALAKSYGEARSSDDALMNDRAPTEAERQKYFEDTYSKDALGFYTDIIEKWGQAGIPLIESDDDLRRAFKNAGFPDNAGFIQHIQDLYRQRKKGGGDAFSAGQREAGEHPLDKRKRLIERVEELNKLPEYMRGPGSAAYKEITQILKDLDNIPKHYFEEDPAEFPERSMSPEDVAHWEGVEKRQQDLEAEIDFLNEERNDLLKYIRSRENEPSGDPIGDKHFQDAWERLQDVEEQIKRIEAEAAGDERNFTDDDIAHWEEVERRMEEEPEFFENYDNPEHDDTLDPLHGETPGPKEPWKDEIDPETKRKALDVLRQVTDRVQRGGRRDPNYSEIIEAFDAAGLPSEDAFVQEIAQAYRDDLQTRQNNMHVWGWHKKGKPYNRVFSDGGLVKDRSRPQLEDLRSRDGLLSGPMIVEEMGGRRPIKEGPAAPEGPILGQPRNRMDPMGGFSMNEGFGALDKGIEVLRKGAQSFKKWREAMKKEGVDFQTAKQAKQAWRDTLRGYNAVFNDGVINVEKYALDVSGSRHLAEIAGRHRELKESQAETKSGLLGEAREFANGLGLEYDRIDIDKAKKLTGREIKYREIAVEENMKAMEQAAEMLNILPDDLKPEVRQFIEAVERQTDNLLHDVIIGAGQKGRDLNMLKAYSTKIESHAFWATQAKKHLGPETPLTWDVEAEIMKLVNNLKETKRGTQARRDAEAALRGRVRRLQERHWAQQLADLFKAAITPLGVVDVANFATNTSISGVKTVDQTFSSFMEKVVAPLFFGGRRTVMSPFVRGSGAKRIEALKNAKLVGKGTMAGGADPTLGGKFAAQHGEITLLPSQKANYYINKYLDFHWRRFGAADAAQREYIMTLSLWNDAHARAVNEGFKGKERMKRAEQLFRDPDVLMASRAIERAQTATFTKENQVADFLTLGRSKLTPGIKAGSHVAVPFAKTLANIAEMTIDYTPVVGLAKNAIGTSRMKRAMKGRQAGERIMNDAKGGSVEALAKRQAADKERVAEEAQRRLIETLGRQMTGAGVVAIGYLLALQDKLTGYGPLTKAEREHWEAEGRQAMSVRMGDKWRRYDRIVGPMAPLLALGAEAHKTSEELKRNDPGVTTGDRVKRVARGFSGTVVESAPGGSLTIFGRRQTADPEGSFLGNTATSALNVLGLGRVAEATDPFERRTENFKERLQSRIPIARTRLPVKTTATGEPVKNETRGVALFDPTRPRRDRSTPVLREMRRLGVEMTRPSDKGTYSRQQQTQRFRAGESETRVPEQYDRPIGEVDRIAEISGPRIQERLGQLMNRSVYQRWDDGQKKRAIQSIMNAERARADRLVTREYRRQGVMPGEQ